MSLAEHTRDLARRQAARNLVPLRSDHVRRVQQLLQEMTGHKALERSETGSRLVTDIRQTYRLRAEVIWAAIKQAVLANATEPVSAPELTALFASLFEPECADALEPSRDRLARFSEHRFIAEVIEAASIEGQRIVTEADHLVAQQLAQAASVARAAGASGAPRRSSMPDLSGVLRRNALTLLLCQEVTGAGPAAFLVRSWSIGFVRLVDLALQDYERARLAFTDYADHGRETTSLLHAVGHVEHCFTSLQRALRLASCLAGASEFGARIPAVEAVSADTRRRVRALQEASEHLDDRLAKGEIMQGELTTLHLSEEGLHAGGERIAYAELARWLQQLQEMAHIVAHFQEPQIAH